MSLDALLRDPDVRSVRVYREQSRRIVVVVTDQSKRRKSYSAYSTNGAILAAINGQALRRQKKIDATQKNT